MIPTTLAGLTAAAQQRTAHFVAMSAGTPFRRRRHTPTTTADTNTEDALYRKAWGQPPTAQPAARPAADNPTGLPADLDALYRKAWPNPPAPNELTRKN